MCDLFSWGVPHECYRDKFVERFGKMPEVIYLTDAEASHMIEHPEDYPKIRGWDSVIGHTAIAEYYHLDSHMFKHKESTKQIPSAMAADVREGKLDKIIRASDNFAMNPGQSWRYTKGGRRNYGKSEDVAKRRREIAAKWREVVVTAFPELEAAGNIRSAEYLSNQNSRFFSTYVLFESYEKLIRNDPALYDKIKDLKAEFLKTMLLYR